MVSACQLLVSTFCFLLYCTFTTRHNSVFTSLCCACRCNSVPVFYRNSKLEGIEWSPSTRMYRITRPTSGLVGVRKWVTVHNCGEPILFLNTQWMQRKLHRFPPSHLTLHERRRLDLSHLVLDRKVGPTVNCTHVHSFGRLRSNVGTEAVAMLWNVHTAAHLGAAC